MISSKAVAGALVVLGLTVANQVAALELRLAHFSPPTHFLNDKILKPFADHVAAATKGEVTVRIYPSGELGSRPAEQFGRVVSGVADMALGLPGYTAAQFPRTLLMELPGAVASAEVATQAVWNAIDLIEPEFSRVKILALYTSEPAILMMRNKEVRSPADLKGMKIRVPSANAGKVVEAWGGVPVFAPAPDVYNAMQTGVMDGVLISPSTIKSYRLDEVVSHYILNVPTTITVFYVVMNRASYDKLTAEQKAAIDAFAPKKFSEIGNKAYLEVAAEAIKYVEGKPGETIIRLSAAEAKAFADASKDTLDQIVKQLDGQGHPASKIVEKLQATGAKTN